MNYNPKLARDLNISVFVHGCLEGAALSFCIPVHQNGFELDIRACRDTIHLFTNDPSKPTERTSSFKSWNCLAVLSVTVFISWYTCISVVTTGSSHTAVISGRQGLWSTFSLKPFCFISLGALIQAERAACSVAADRQQCNWEQALLLCWPPLKFPVVSESSNSEHCPQGQGFC